MTFGLVDVRASCKIDFLCTLVCQIKRESLNFLNSSGIRTEKTYLYFVEISILIHHFLLGHFERVKVAAQDHQIDSDNKLPLL